jgi:hypothetical protein
LADAIGVDGERMLDWCVAFAGMIARELAASPDPPEDRIHKAALWASSMPKRCRYWQDVA